MLWSVKGERVAIIEDGRDGLVLSRLSEVGVKGLVHSKPVVLLSGL